MYFCSFTLSTEVGRLFQKKQNILFLKLFYIYTSINSVYFQSLLWISVLINDMVIIVWELFGYLKS